MDAMAQRGATALGSAVPEPTATSSATRLTGGWISGEHYTRTPPVLLIDLLNHDMDVFRIFPQHTNQGIGNVFDQFGLLPSGGTFRNLNIYVWHIIVSHDFILASRTKKANATGQLFTPSHPPLMPPANEVNYPQRCGFLFGADLGPDLLWRQQTSAIAHKNQEARIRWPPRQRTFCTTHRA